jgi:uncharacterized membrane protein YgcG
MTVARRGERRFPTFAWKMLWLGAALALVGTASADERTLYWRALDVSARLDTDARLHVRERHAMVFDGAWNGGERRFRVARGQALALVRLTRIDADGQAHALQSGDLSAVDQYQWIDGNTLRWRSRRPSDPLFRNTERLYEIEYVLSDILIPRGGLFVLDYDFAFPDRPGAFRRFTLELQIDPVWQPLAEVPAKLVRENLAPGQSVVVTVSLRYTGAVAPHSVAPAWRYFLVVVFAVFLLWNAIVLLANERRLGRFRSLPPPGAIDHAWLEQQLLRFPPEVVGAAWDKKTASAEVAAMLARMTLEGKLKSEIRREGIWIFKSDVLHLQLHADRNALPSQERRLIDALFFDGDTTDAYRLRQHYRKQGLDPADLIRAKLAARLSAMGADALPGHAARVARTASLGLAAAALFGFEFWQDSETAALSAILAIVALMLYVLVRFQAERYQLDVIHTRPRIVIASALWFLLAASLVIVLVTDPLQLSLSVLAALTLLWAALFNSACNAMRSRDKLEFIQLRQDFAAARRYFQQQLKAQDPRLRDDWLPYLLAFGLGPDVDRWFRAYGRSEVAARSGGSASGSAGSTGVWTGGAGGTFGGGGATGSWSIAVAGIATSVSAASSSSGGGGGGGSSGGGGGGGW